MMMIRKNVIATMVVLCVTLCVYAQHHSSFSDTIPAVLRNATDGPSKSVASMLSLGAANYLDTYLSPLEKYRGAEMRFVSEVLRDSRKRPMSYVLSHEVAVARLSSRYGNTHEFAAHYDFSYGAMYRMALLNDKLTLRLGAMVEGYLGGCYNDNNQANNPAQGYASMSIGPMAMAQYRFEMFGKEISVGYAMRMPMLGAMFSPNYGQSYYEIFNRGDYDHNIVFVSPSHIQMRQMLSFDISLSKRKAIRVGYLGDYRQATPNNLKQHQYYNAFLLGLLITK